MSEPGSEIVTATITIDVQLLSKIDSRARELDLNRSQYFRRLAREDLRLSDADSIAHQEHQNTNGKSHE